MVTRKGATARGVAPPSATVATLATYREHARRYSGDCRTHERGVSRRQAGKSAELGAELLKLAAPTRRAPGWGPYEIHQFNDDRNARLILEDWGNAADFQAHMAAPEEFSPS